MILIPSLLLRAFLWFCNTFFCQLGFTRVCSPNITLCPCNITYLTPNLPNLLRLLQTALLFLFVEYWREGLVGVLDVAAQVGDVAS
ncbi:hypothetical protein ACVWV0_000948 [Ewingella americana]